MASYLVTTLSNTLVSKKLRKLDFARQTGLQVYQSEGFFIRHTKNMGPEERLLAQLGIFASLKMLVDEMLLHKEPSTDTHAAFKNTQRFQDLYDIVSKSEYPGLDKLMAETRQKLVPPAPPSEPKRFNF